MIAISAEESVKIAAPTTTFGFLTVFSMEKSAVVSLGWVTKSEAGFMLGRNSCQLTYLHTDA
jgi:hypothetical protein